MRFFLKGLLRENMQQKKKERKNDKIKRRNSERRVISPIYFSMQAFSVFLSILSFCLKVSTNDQYRHTCIQQIFWFLSFGCAVSFAGYFINNIFERYINNSIIVSISPNPIPSNELAFPTVTICNMNRVNKIEVETLLQNGSDLHKRYINNLCRFNKFTTIKTTEQNKTEFIDFMIQVSPSCNNMLKACFWLKEEVNCYNIFSTMMTDIGACCSFNQLPLWYIFRNPLNISALNIKHPELAEDWNYEKGYSNNSTNMTIPRKIIGTGLTVILDTNIDNYYCSSSNSLGFKVAATDPVEIPRLKDFAINMSPGLEGAISLEPVLTGAEDNVKHSHISTRECFFNNEKYLSLFRTYTMHNCLIECQVNLTLERCNCVPSYLMISSSERFCEYKDEVCVNEVLDSVPRNEKIMQQRNICNCLPSCAAYDFSKHISYGKLSASFQMQQKYTKNISADYFVKNALILHFHFTKSSYPKHVKSEIYGLIELLSNVGGLLAIFLGFSIMNVVEVMYHTVCKIIPVILQTISEKFAERKVYPFVK